MRISFTDRELDVMAVLWERGSGTVGEVRDALADEFARTTVLTVLRTLKEKGHVSHVVEGKAYRYSATVGPDAAGRSALSRILDTMFAGSPEKLLAQLVSDRQIDRKKLKQLRAVLDARLSARGKGGER
jgi:BlaI family transcriptional regulator, penicillinase repressor